MAKTNKYLYDDGENIFINCPYAEAYIPADIFDSATDETKESSVAYSTGDSIVTIGMFYIRFFDSPDQPREKATLKTLIYPNKIETFPYESSSIEVLDINDSEDKYRILKYSHGDKLMDATSNKASNNCERFTNMMFSGRIPDSVSYDELAKTWKENFDINNVNKAVPYVALQALVAKMARNPNDLNEEFRFLIGKSSKVNPFKYKMLNMNAVSAYSSVIASMAFERFGEKLGTSMIMTKEGIAQQQSPIEKIVRM